MPVTRLLFRMSVNIFVLQTITLLEVLIQNFYSINRIPYNILLLYSFVIYTPTH